RDDMQRQGVGTRLLRLLIGLAGGRGVRTVHATLQAENRPARQLLRKLGLAYHTEIRYGEKTACAELPRDHCRANRTTTFLDQSPGGQECRWCQRAVDWHLSL